MLCSVVQLSIHFVDHPMFQYYTQRSGATVLASNAIASATSFLYQNQNSARFTFISPRLLRPVERWWLGVPNREGAGRNGQSSPRCRHFFVIRRSERPGTYLKTPLQRRSNQGRTCDGISCTPSFLFLDLCTPFKPRREVHWPREHPRRS